MNCKQSKARRSPLILLVVLVVVSFLVPPVSHANPSTRPNDAFVFPIQPGTPTWQAFESHDQMLAACQIPEDLLKTMSTVGLVDTVMRYPLLGDMAAYNSTQHGVDAVAAGFNGLSEMLMRPDAGAALMDVYRALDPTALSPAWTSVQRGEYAANLSQIEALLAQRSIVASLSSAERLQLLDQAFQKAQAKQKLAQTYGHSGLERSVWLIVRVLEGMNLESVNEAIQANTALGAFLDEGHFAAAEEVNQIYAAASEILSREFEPDRAVAPEDYSSYVYTPKGTAVSVITRTYELTQDQINQMNAWVQQNYPCATRETNASRKYNCHSYGWYSTSTSNDRWMNSPGDDTYWNDRSYFFIKAGSGDTIPSIIPNSAKVSYASDDHSAIKVSSTQLRSKWGQYPRMLHKPVCSPYSATTISYYQPNLILKVSAYATSYYSSTYAPAKGNDGDLNTRWSSQQSQSLPPQWWWADMSTSKTVNNVQVKWEAAYAKRVFVGTSTDCVTFSGYWYTHTSAGYYRYVLGDRSARCVGVYMTERAPNMTNYSFWEAEAFRTNPNGLGLGEPDIGDDTSDATASSGPDTLRLTQDQ